MGPDKTLAYEYREKMASENGTRGKEMNWKRRKSIQKEAKLDCGPKWLI